MTTPLHRPARRARAAVIVVALASIAFGVSAAAPNAASGPLTVAPITWDVLGLDSNNVGVGPTTPSRLETAELPARCLPGPT